MKLFRRCIAALLTIAATIPAQAQMEDQGIVTETGFRRYITVGAGATYQSFIDNAISRYNYWGVGFAPSLGHIKQSDFTYSEFLVQGSMLRFSRNKKDLLPLYVKSKRAVMDYRFLVRIPVDYDNRNDVRAGAMLNMMYSYKNAPHLQDAQDIHEYAVTFGLSGRYQKEMQYYKKQVQFTWDVSIPFVAHYTRPAYLNRVENLDPDNKWLSDFVSTGVTESINKYFRLSSRVGFTYPSENGNMYRLSYQWDYYNIKHNTQLYFAEHTIMLTLMFNY